MSPATRSRGSWRKFITSFSVAQASCLWGRRASCLPCSEVRWGQRTLQHLTAGKPSLLENFSFHLPALSCRRRPRRNFINPVSRQILLGIAVLGLIVPSASADPFPDAGPVVSGKVARLRFGKAAAPKNAPLAVKRAIWAAYQPRSRLYRYGGGHKSFDDRGYDCSGTISYALGAAGETTSLACILECGGAPPLIISAATRT